jgi:tryptophanyl-tRNA synthetase
MSKKILLSGIQPTGAPHIGNYFGMMKQVVDAQNEYEVYGMIVNYHALTTVQNKQELQDNTKNVVLDFLAIGVDPEKWFCLNNQMFQSILSLHGSLTA